VFRIHGDKTMSRRTTNIIIGVIVLGLIVAGAATAFIFFTGGSGEASEAISAPTLEANEEAAGGDATVFRIVPEQSEVRFNIFEELRGEPVTVVGTTNQIAGDIRVDFANPANSEVGTIRVNVRTLVTDNEFRPDFAVSAG
jgi:polyisoprenoid-binding protein YceI